MSEQRDSVSATGESLVQPNVTKSRGLHIPVPAVLLGLGMLSGSVHAAPIQDVYSTPVNQFLSGVNIFASDAANNPQNVICTTPTNGFTNVSPTGGLFYQPANSFIGIDSFSCTGSDNLGNISAFVQIYVGVPVPAAVLPTVSPVALGGLAAILAFFGLRRRRKA